MADLLTRFALAGVTNYVAWGVAESGWEANGLAAFSDLPATNGFTVANSNVTVYAKAYRDLNRNGEYAEGEDVLYVRTLTKADNGKTVTVAVGDTRQLIGKVAIPNTDITIGIVNEALPTNDLRAVYLLPENYPNYLGTLIRLPVVQVNQDKLAIVQEISRTVTSANRYYEFECSRSSNNLRYPFGMGIRLHDSGSPCYLIVGDKPVLLYAIQGYWYELINGVISGAGFNTALFAEEIQAIMNDLSDAKNLPRVGINFFNFSQYEQLSNWR